MPNPNCKEFNEFVKTAAALKTANAMQYCDQVAKAAFLGEVKDMEKVSAEQLAGVSNTALPAAVAVAICMNKIASGEVTVEDAEKVASLAEKVKGLVEKGKHYASTHHVPGKKDVAKYLAAHPGLTGSKAKMIGAAAAGGAVGAGAAHAATKKK